jgi:beta-N-acetylhexosaminidase
VVRDIIRGEIGFDGVLVTDDLAMGALDGAAAGLAVAAIGAGCDLVLHCTGRIAESAALLAGCPLLGDRAAGRMAGASAIRDAFARQDATLLRAIRDGAAAPGAVGADPTARGG